MKKFVAIVAVLLAGVILYCLSQLGRGLRHAAIIQTQNHLLSALAQLNEHGTFTNPSPHSCHIYTFTNHYLVSGTNFHCVLAADSWGYQRGTGVIAITSNQMLLYIEHQRAAPLALGHVPPGL